MIGEVSAFDQDIQESIARLEQYSQKYDEIYFQIALNYGSRDEIIRGIRKLAQDAADGKVKPKEIDEHVLTITWIQQESLIRSDDPHKR